MTMTFFGRQLPNDGPLLIAEIGVNHEGDIDSARRMIDAAADAGAHAVKFQCYTPERFIAAGDAERLERVRRFGFSAAAFRDLAAHAAAAGTAFFASAISEDWVPFIAETGGAIKVASGDIDFRPVIAAAAESGAPTILSTGAADREEIDQAVAWFKDALPAGATLETQLMLMHCVSAYPTPADQANLAAIPRLADETGLLVGYSNHVAGVDACLAAVALGAVAVEAHFTDRREGRTFRDHHLSLEPAEFADLAVRTPVFAAMRGSGVKTMQPAEAGMVPAIRKGVVVARDLPAGAVLAAADLAFARPGGEYRAVERDDLVGKRLNRAMAAGETLPRDAVDG